MSTPETEYEYVEKGRVARLEAELAEAATCAEENETLRGLLYEAKRQLTDYQSECREVEQVLGKALGYPWYKDDQRNFPGATGAEGVCVGEHVPGTIAAEAARALTEARRARRDGEIQRGVSIEHLAIISERDAARAALARTAEREKALEAGKLLAEHERNEARARLRAERQDGGRGDG